MRATAVVATVAAVAEVTAVTVVAVVVVAATTVVTSGECRYIDLTLIKLLCNARRRSSKLTHWKS